MPSSTPLSEPRAARSNQAKIMRVPQRVLVMLALGFALAMSGFLVKPAPVFGAAGDLVPAFDGDGVVTTNPSGSTDIAYAIAMDSTSMYVAGYDSAPSFFDWQWRIEKRDLTTGALDGTFGGGTGVVTSNPSGGDDRAYAIAIDSPSLYVAGYASSPGNPQWRPENRSLPTGALSGTFGGRTAVVLAPHQLYRASSSSHAVLPL